MVALYQALVLLFFYSSATFAASVPFERSPQGPGDTHDLVQSTDLAGRPFNLDNWVVQAAGVFAGSKLTITTWQSVARACQEIKEQDTMAEKLLKSLWDCAIGAVAALIAQGFWALAAMSLAQKALPVLREWLNHRIGTESLDDKDLVARETIPHLSTIFGAEVRHIGHWNDTVTGAASRKRDSGLGQPGGLLRPVFGATIYGQDFHFSLLDHDEEQNDLRVRVGFGPGGSEEGGSSSSRPLERRDDRPYFTEGGIDYKLAPLMPAVQGIDKYDERVFANIYEQLYCLWHADWDYPRAESSQVYFQIYDHTFQGTRLAANVAAFGFDGHSGIDEMGDYRSSIESNQNCRQYRFGDL